MQIYGKKTCANCRSFFFLKTYKRLFKISKRCKDVLRPVFQDALLTNCRSQLKNFQRSEAQTFVSTQPESLSFVMKLECFVDREVVFFEKLESFAEFSVCSQLVSTFLFWCLKLKLRWFLQWLSYLAKFLQSLNLASATRHIQNALQGISRVFWMLRPELLNIVMLIHFVVVWYAKFTCLHLTHWTQICRFLEVLWVAQTSEGSKGPRFEVDPSSKWVRARQGPWSGLEHKLCNWRDLLPFSSPEKNDKWCVQGRSRQFGPGPPCPGRQVQAWWERERWERESQRWQKWQRQRIQRSQRSQRSQRQRLWKQRIQWKQWWLGFSHVV